MNGPWAMQLEASEWQTAAELRLRSDVRAGQADESIWLRGDELTEELELALRKLGGRRFTVSSRGALTLPGERTPCGTLPTLPWVPLSRLIVPAPQVAALPGERPTRAVLRLVHGGSEREPNVLRTTLALWAAYASGAPLLRLRRLSFAADATGNVLIRGSPLPPLAGDRYVEEAGVAIPCGYEWRPRVDAKVVAALIGLSSGDLALMDAFPPPILRGTDDVGAPQSEISDLKSQIASTLALPRSTGGGDKCEVIAAASFVGASRGAVRRTLQAVRP